MHGANVRRNMVTERRDIVLLAEYQEYLKKQRTAVVDVEERCAAQPGLFDGREF